MDSGCGVSLNADHVRVLKLLVPDVLGKLQCLPLLHGVRDEGSLRDLSRFAAGQLDKLRLEPHVFCNARVGENRSATAVML